MAGNDATEVGSSAGTERDDDPPRPPRPVIGFLRYPDRAGGAEGEYGTDGSDPMDQATARLKWIHGAARQRRYHDRKEPHYWAHHPTGGEIPGPLAVVACAASAQVVPESLASW